MPIIADISICSDAANACNTNHPLLNVGEPTLLGTVYILGEINLPAQTVVDGQLRGCAPTIFTVVEHAMLALSRVGARAHVTIHASCVSQQEARKRHAAGTCIRSDAIGEVVDPGTV